jgi:IS5 family transposase
MMAMRLVWIQQFMLQADQVLVREKSDLPPCSKRIDTVHDLDARFATHGPGKSWTGYRVHVTESLSDDAQTPQLIVNVATTPATTPDKVAFADILPALPDHDVHLVDTGYTTLDNAEVAQDRKIDLVGRMQMPGHNNLDRSYFSIDWERQQVTCPQGAVSTKWYRGSRRGQMTNQVYFDKRTCQSCPLRNACTSSKTRGRTLRFYDKDRDRLLQNLRARQKTQAFKDVYRQRAGIEGTISQLVRATHLRVSRYVGLAKTHLHNTLAAVAVNLARWFRAVSDVKRASTRKSRLVPMLT